MLAKLKNVFKKSSSTNALSGKAQFEIDENLDNSRIHATLTPGVRLERRSIGMLEFRFIAKLVGFVNFCEKVSS